MDELFVGTKLVKAKPMTRQQYNDYRGWDTPDKEKDVAHAAGYLVEYLDGGRANDSRHEGYISWSPMDVFCGSYRASGSFNFGHAIELAKHGHKIARKGWNGKGINIFIVKKAEGYRRVSSGGTLPVTLQEHIDTTGLQTTNPDAPKSVVPWLASQTDILAEDWCVI